MNICVFCSSSDAVDKKYFDFAEKLAAGIASRKYVLLYGGAKVGLMGTIAKEAKKLGTKVIGVIPQVIHDKGLALQNLDNLIVTSDMHTRKAKLEELADAFVALPGGFGTLEELAEVITLKQLEYHKKPIIILNIDDFYKNLLEMFETMYTENFAKSDYRKMYFVTENLEEAFNYIENYTVPQLESKWYRTNLNL
jgi:hypothetical protein